jgi:hypothetical protein
MKTANEPPRDIPEPTKRLVRQRCGFACISCGSPLYEYHHINTWAGSHSHNAPDITLLCPNEHQEATGPNATIAESVVREWDAHPYALRTGQSAPKPLRYRDTVRVTVGGVTAEYDHHSFVALAIGGEPVIWVDMQNGIPLINAHFWDSSGETILRIDRGEWAYSVNRWDVTYVANLLTVREGRGKFALEIRFAAPHAIHITRATLFDGQRTLTIKHKKSMLGSNTFEGIVLSGNREAALNLAGLNSTSLKMMHASIAAPKSDRSQS